MNRKPVSRWEIESSIGFLIHGHTIPREGVWEMCFWVRVPLVSCRGGLFFFSFLRAIMPPPAPVRRMAVMGIPNPSAEARAAEERKEKKKKKLEEKKAAHRRAIEKKRLQKKEKMEKEKKKKEDKKKEVH